MKALSLWQPWATLIAIGAKRIETRGWSTSYRGPLLICSAKRAIDCVTRDWMETEEAFVDSTRGITEFPLGVALCRVTLGDCIPTGQGLIKATVRESLFGDYTVGRFGWILDDVLRLPVPIPLRGAQGLFDVPAEVEEQVRQALGVKL